MTSVGGYIDWREEIGVEFDIPPEAVPESKKLKMSVWPCSKIPFQLPENYEQASPVLFVSPSFEFSRKITLKMCHFSKLETVEDCEKMVFLSAPTTPSELEVTNKPVYKFKELGKGSFEPHKDYGQIPLRHFCYVCIAHPKDQAKREIYIHSV